MVRVRRLVTLAALVSAFLCGTAVLGADKGGSKPPKKETTKKDTEKKSATVERQIPDWTDITGKVTADKSKDKTKEKDSAKAKDQGKKQGKDKGKIQGKDKDKDKESAAVFEDFTRTPASQGKEPFVVYFYWPEADTSDAKANKDCGSFEQALAAAAGCEKALEGFGRYKCDAKKLDKELRKKYAGKVPRLAVYDTDGKLVEGVTVFPAKEGALAYRLAKLTKDAKKVKDDAKKVKDDAKKVKDDAKKVKDDAKKVKDDAKKDKSDADEGKSGSSKR